MDPIFTRFTVDFGLSALFWENSLDIKVKTPKLLSSWVIFEYSPPPYTQCGTKLYLDLGQLMVVFFLGGRGGVEKLTVVRQSVIYCGGS
jgi:hypothetical protein